MLFVFRETMRYRQRQEGLEKLQLSLLLASDLSLGEKEDARKTWAVWTPLNPKRGDPPTHRLMETE